jgi:hypothetical protein
MEVDSVHGLPDNLDSLPEIKVDDGLVVAQHEVPRVSDGQQKGVRKAWGPVLVEKRPNKRPVDGRTILEKAQKRKKVVNLETRKIGNKPSNSFFIMSQSEIAITAKSVGIKLGSDVVEVEKAIVEIQDIDRSRGSTFTADCSSCNKNKDSLVKVEEVDDMSSSLTPVDCSVWPQLEDDVESHGRNLNPNCLEWLIGRNLNPNCLDERYFLEH